MKEELRFDEETHTYWRGEKQLISVTQLLAKHGLGSDYSAVNETTLKRKADRGKLIHEEIENYIGNGEIGFTTEFVDYLRIMKELNLIAQASEQIICGNDIAGTFDLLAYDSCLTYLIDFKTTAKLNVEAISWQLSLYSYLLNDIADKFYAFHLLPNHRSKAVEIQPKSFEQIERLLECERNGEIYQENLPELKIDEKQLAELTRCEQQLAELKRQEQAFQEVTEKIRSAILNAMEENGVKSFESDLLKITYVAPYEKEQVDTAKLRAEQPNVYRKYLKTSQVNASLRVKLKE